MKKVSTEATFQTLKKIRKDWGNISPVTKVIEDKRHKKPKHKNKIYEE